jgi:hypothetical protein
MRSCITCLFLVLFCVVTLSIPAPVAGGEQRVSVTASRLNLRESPGTDARILASLTRGDILVRLDERDGWLQVRTGAGLVGWVSRDHVQPVSESETTRPVEPGKIEAGSTRQESPATAPAHGSGGARRIIKYACLAGAGAAAVLAYSEHSAGNDTYDKYKDLVMAGDDAAAEIQYDETGTHDDKAKTWMIVSGLLAGAYILQEFILDRGRDDRAALERSPRVRLGWDPRRDEVTAAVVLLRY